MTEYYWNSPHQEYNRLSTAYLSAFVADVMNCKSIAFPLLASGNNGFDLQIAFETAKESLESFEPRKDLKKVMIVLYGIRSIQVARDQGISVEEVIDNKYILANDENYTSPGQ